MLYRLVFLFFLILGISSSVYVGISVNENSKRHILDRVNTLSKVISSEEIKSLYASEQDLNNPTYNKVKDLLVNIRSVNSDIRFIYINGIENNKLFFYADSELSDSEDYSPPGQSYDEATPLMFDVFDNKGSQFEISGDRWGYWVSAYSPIIDKNSGLVVALIGMDIPANNYIFNILVNCSIPLLVTIVLLIIMYALRRFYDNERDYLNKKMEFLSVATHEIRTPLTGVKWATEELIKKHETQGYDSKNTLLDINKTTVNLIKIINNFLDMSTIGDRNITDTKQLVAFKDLLEKIKDDLKLTALSKNTIINISDTLTYNLKIKCNGTQIRHVLINLLSNAIKYSKQGGEIEIKYIFENDMHKISISNQGDEINKEDQEKIFDGLYRTKTSVKKAEEGTGMGLYMSRKIARVYGGDIVVSSAGGKNTFTLLLR